jgi:hypothetical protein
MSSKEFSTSYTPQQLRLITELVRSVGAESVLEIGVQQGFSGLALCQGVVRGGTYDGVDLWQPKYPLPPHGETHADKKVAHERLAAAKHLDRVSLWYPEETEHLKKCQFDVLHIDICNHLGNLPHELAMWAFYTDKLILLEGGIKNYWHTKDGYFNYRHILNQPRDPMVGWSGWDWITIPFSDHNALTIGTPKIGYQK